MADENQIASGSPEDRLQEVAAALAALEAQFKDDLLEEQHALAEVQGHFGIKSPAPSASQEKTPSTKEDPTQGKESKDPVRQRLRFATDQPTTATRRSSD